MSPIDVIVSCNKCGRVLSDSQRGDIEEYWYLTHTLESSKDARKRTVKNIVLCGDCLAIVAPEITELMRLAESR